MIENEQPELCARIDALHWLLRTLIQGLAPAGRDSFRSNFEVSAGRWRELLIMSRASDAYLSALDAEIGAWRDRLSEESRDAPPRP